jgi:hypothetical protein
MSRTVTFRFVLPDLQDARAFARAAVGTASAVTAFAGGTAIVAGRLARDITTTVASHVVDSVVVGRTDDGIEPYVRQFVALSADLASAAARLECEGVDSLTNADIVAGRESIQKLARIGQERFGHKRFWAAVRLHVSEPPP